MDDGFVTVVEGATGADCATLFDPAPGEFGIRLDVELGWIRRPQGPAWDMRFGG